MADLAVGGKDDSIDDVIGEIQLQLALRREQRHERSNVLGIHLTGVVREIARDVKWRDDRDVVLNGRLARNTQLAVATLLSGEIYDHRSWPHRFDGGFVDQYRRGLTRNQRGRDDDIGLGSALMN